MSEVRICREPLWDDAPARAAWSLEWVDPFGVRRRLLVGYGEAARQAAQDHADRLANGAVEGPGAAGRQPASEAGQLSLFNPGLVCQEVAEVPPVG